MSISLFLVFVLYVWKKWYDSKNAYQLQCHATGDQDLEAQAGSGERVQLKDICPEAPRLIVHGLRDSQIMSPLPHTVSTFNFRISLPSPQSNIENAENEVCRGFIT
jgi:hypothetical protein